MSWMTMSSLHGSPCEGSMEGADALRGAGITQTSGGIMTKTITRLALAVMAIAVGFGTPAIIAGTAPAASATSWPAGWVLPNHHLTPGADGHSFAQVCPHVSAALENGRPSTAVKNQVYAAYHITYHP